MCRVSNGKSAWRKFAAHQDIRAFISTHSSKRGDMPSKVSSLIVLAAASIALTFGVAGCNKSNPQDTSAQSQPAQTDQSQDPAASANLAPTDGTQATQQTSSGSAEQQGSQDQNYSNNDYNADYQDASYGQPVLQAQHPPTAAGIFAASLPRRWLSVDARILELRSSGLLLGARRLGEATSSGLSVDAGILGQGRTTLISHREVSLFGNSSAEYALSRCLRLVRIDHPAGDCGSLSSVECRTLLANPSIRQEGMAGTVIGVKRVHFAGSRAHQA
jgi:hypothetical protein